MPYDFAIDVWSIGCTLYEMYTGKILFTGRTNNQMLRSMMECRGKFSHKLLRKGQFTNLHFDDMLNFRSVEKDKITGRVSGPLPQIFVSCTFSPQPCIEASPALVHARRYRSANNLGVMWPIFRYYRTW